MEALETQQVKSENPTLLIKIVILILNALCGVTIYCLLQIRGIRPELHDLCGMVAGLFFAIALVTWVAWPTKK